MSWPHRMVKEELEFWTKKDSFKMPCFAMLTFISIFWWLMYVFCELNDIAFFARLALDGKLLLDRSRLKINNDADENADTTDDEEKKERLSEKEREERHVFLEKKRQDGDQNLIRFKKDEWTIA